jgi:hypothetical protein
MTIEIIVSVLGAFIFIIISLYIVKTRKKPNVNIGNSRLALYGKTEIKETSSGRDFLRIS